MKNLYVLVFALFIACSLNGEDEPEVQEQKLSEIFNNGDLPKKDDLPKKPYRYKDPEELRKALNANPGKQVQDIIAKETQQGISDENWPVVTESNRDLTMLELALDQKNKQATYDLWLDRGKWVAGSVICTLAVVGIALFCNNVSIANQLKRIADVLPPSAKVTEWMGLNHASKGSTD